MKKITLFDVLPWLWRGKSIPRAMMNTLLKEVKLLRGVTLDLGGGDHPSYLGILPIEGTLQTLDMRTETKPTFVGDLEKELPIPNGYADTVLLLNTLEHVFNYKQLIAEIQRILKQGGKTIVFVPFMFSYHTHQTEYFFIDDYFRYSKSALMRLFKESGFSEVQITPVGGLFWVAADQLNMGFKYRIFSLFITIISGLLEFLLTRNRGFNSTEKFPLAYFIEAKK